MNNGLTFSDVSLFMKRIRFYMGIIRYVTQIAQIYECFLIFLCKDSIIIWYSKNNYTEKSENIFSVILLI